MLRRYIPCMLQVLEHRYLEASETVHRGQSLGFLSRSSLADHTALDLNTHKVRSNERTKIYMTRKTIRALTHALTCPV